MGNSLKKILLATDSSEDAGKAARAATDISGRSGAELHVAHVWQDLPASAYPGLSMPADHREIYEKEARTLLEEQAGEISASGGTVIETHLREGRPAEEIVGLAGELGADLVALGSRGLGGVKRLVVGSVSEEVARLAGYPTLVMRGAEPWPPARIVVGDDSSEAAARAGEVAATLGRLTGAEVLLAWASPADQTEDAAASREAEEFLEARAAELEEELGHLPETRAVVGEAEAVLQRLVDERRGTSLLAVGNRGLGAVRRAVLESVSTGLLRSVDGPVLISPDPGRTQDEV